MALLTPFHKVSNDSSALLFVPIWFTANDGSVIREVLEVRQSCVCISLQISCRRTFVMCGLHLAVPVSVASTCLSCCIY